MLKVLMLGWEFPPHISGGLGIACHGLTAALVKDHDLHVNLVLPVVHGDESSDGATLISASESIKSITSKQDGAASRANQKSSEHKETVQGGKLVITKIQADLDPYRLANETTESTVPWNLKLSDGESTATRSAG